uniref:Uncharacterized protein n=1 Tax=Rhizophora mucronata TaxID=61149 RepID=A0A2P2JI95_RHIMU
MFVQTENGFEIEMKI